MKNGIKCLILEDNPIDIKLVSSMIEKASNGNIMVTSSLTLFDALKLIQKAPPDIIVLDLGLPDSTGLNTLTNILRDFPNIPVIVLSVTSDPDIAIEAIRLGAQDYLIKGQVNDALLVRSIFFAIERNKIFKR